jgi:hypothetical protein
MLGQVTASPEALDPARPGARCCIKIEGEWQLARVTTVADDEVEAKLDNGRLVVGSWHDRDFRPLD